MAVNRKKTDPMKTLFKIGAVLVATVAVVAAFYPPVMAAVIYTGAKFCGGQ